MQFIQLKQLFQIKSTTQHLYFFNWLPRFKLKDCSVITLSRPPSSFLSEGEQPFFPSCITMSLESASQWTSPTCWSWRLITIIWSHTCQFIISCITTVTIHYFSLPLQTQNSSFPQIFSSVVLLTIHPLDWLHGLQLFFVFLEHVGFNFGIVC